MKFIRLLIYIFIIIPTVAQTHTPNSLLNPAAIQKLYSMMQDFHAILSNNNVPYFITCGTLLGAVRNQKIIKWDDDIDIGIFDIDADRFCKLESEFNARGYQLSKCPEGYFFKIAPSDGEPCRNGGDWVGNYPWIDVMVWAQYGNKIVYHKDGPWASVTESEFIDIDLFPLKKYQLGNLSLWGPNNPKNFLDRVYPKWESIYTIDICRIHNKVDNVSGNIVIRKAELKDTAALTNLLGQLGYPQISNEMCESKIKIFSDNKLDTVWVISLNNNIVGCLALNIITPFYKAGLFARIDAIVVDEHHRKLGFGRMLTEIAEEYAKNIGCTKIFLTSGKHRFWAQNFYSNLDFISDATYFVKSLESV